MEISILVAAITISWIYLAYSVQSNAIKTFLSLIVSANIIAVSYLVVAGSDITNLTDDVVGAEIYLAFNLIAFIGFIFFYILQWSTDYLKEKKKKREGL